MKKVIFLSVILFSLVQLAAQQQIIFVKQGSNGDGSSWKNAYGDLQSALLNARAGEEIWVAGGTYYPGNNRNAVFRIQDKVRLYGGFSGNEKNREKRDWKSNLTILSGEIGDPGKKEDNIQTLVYTARVSSSTVVDGFVISGAASNGTSALGGLDRCGGGWFNDGSGGESSPTIVNCLFIDNFALQGAGLYNYANGGVCRPQITNCQFISNSAHLEGGAIFNDGRDGMVGLLIQRCYFLENNSNYGAVMRNLAKGGKSIATITNSIFEANVSFAREIIYNGPQADANCKAVLQSCQFFDNAVSMGKTGNNTTNGSKKQGYRAEGEIKYLVY